VTATASPVREREVDLAISGMTCASCVARIERKLGKLPGVVATVNLPLETAHIVAPEDVSVEQLISTVEAAGYGASVKGEGPGQRNSVSVAPASVPDGAIATETVQTDFANAPAPLADVTQPEPADLEDLGHRGYAGDIDLRGADLRRRLRVAIVLAIPVAVISMIMPLHFPGWAWVVGIMTLPVATWAAWPFHRAAFRAARHGSSTMDTLVSLGVIAAMIWSIVEMTRYQLGQIPHPHYVYFEVAAVVVAFLLAGRLAEHRSRRRAGDALRSLLALGAKDAELVAVDANGQPLRRSDGSWDAMRVPVEALAVGNVFAVRPGTTIATDGEVIEGTGAVDTSLVTGEPIPVDVAPGSAVVGGTINTAGHLLVRATRVGSETTLARIGQLVAQAQTGKAPIARLGDRISAVFVPVVIGLALLTLLGWIVFTGDVNGAFKAAVAVLIIACPCALGLATPTAILVGTGRAAQLGVLIKGPEILERTRAIDTVVLDKTGTVTEGRMALEQVVVPTAVAEVGGGVISRVIATGPASTTDPRAAVVERVETTQQTASTTGPSPSEALAYAAALESLSEHPIATAIASAASIDRAFFGRLSSGRNATASVETTNESSFTVLGFLATPGGGVQGAVTDAATGEARQVLVGQLAWLADCGVDVSTDIAATVAQAETDGATTVVVAWDNTAQAVLILRDPPKPTSAEAVAEFKALGLRPILLTGDSEGAARAAAAAVGIDPADVIARVRPDEKATVVQQLRDEGRMVAMVGDGINDAAALATADLGLAMGTGTDVAIEASDITLVRGDLRAAAAAVRMSRATLRVIKQNLFWAFAYNVAALPLAAMGVLNPMIAGGAMALSSVLVVSNSLRLRRAR